jgi:pyrimidine deaminase RibD-like protein
MQPDVYMYTTMEPCSKRVSGNSPCVARILATRDYGNSRAGCKVIRVYVGAMEPSNFVNCEGI